MEELKTKGKALLDEYVNFEEEDTEELLERAMNLIAEFIKA